MVGPAAAIGKPQHSRMGSIVIKGDNELTYRNTVFKGARIALYNFQRIHTMLIHRETHGSLPLSVVILKYDSIENYERSIEPKRKHAA